MDRSAKHEATQNEQHRWIEEALQGIDDIDWHSLQHAYGPADDVPELLRLLASDDEAVREDAWHELYGTIWHQGTVYEASAYAVPFLLRLFADQRTPDRHAVLEMLQSLAAGSSYMAVHFRDEESISDWRITLAKEGKDFDVELQRELSYVRAANEAVLALFLELAEDANQDAEVRREAIAALAELSTQANLIIPRLRALLDQPDAAPFHVNIVNALHRHMDDSQRSQQFFAKLMQHEADPDAAFTAATALIHRTGEHAPDAAVECVIDALRRHGDEYAYGGDVYNASVDALLKLGHERARPTMLRALPLLHNTDSEELHIFAIAMLDLVFNDGQQSRRAWALPRNKKTGRQMIDFHIDDSKVPPERSSAMINDAQREVLAALAAHDPLWEWDSNLLRLYGLPADREALRAWVEQ